jgi:hypothetical protein
VVGNAKVYPLEACGLDEYFWTERFVVEQRLRFCGAPPELLQITT